MISFTAMPLEGYSSLHQLSILKLIGISNERFSPKVRVIFDFNLQTPSQINSKAILAFRVRDSNPLTKEENAAFCIVNLTRWRIDLSLYESFSYFLQMIKKRHYNRYVETKKTFQDYETKLLLIEGDWSQHAEEFYKLYLNVAKKHGSQLYDLNYFTQIAVMPEYKFMGVWHHDVLVAALILIEEGLTLHSIVCGLDYNHSKKCEAYSWMHYEFIRFAIESKKYTTADVGITANAAKTMLNFEPITCCMDVRAYNFALRAFLRLSSYFVNASIDSNAKLKIRFKLPRRS